MQVSGPILSTAVSLPRAAAHRGRIVDQRRRLDFWYASFSAGASSGARPREVSCSGGGCQSGLRKQGVRNFTVPVSASFFQSS